MNIHSDINKYLVELSEKYNIPIERLMIGIIQNDLYVWDYDSGRGCGKEFKVIEIYKL